MSLGSDAAKRGKRAEGTYKAYGIQTGQGTRRTEGNQNGKKVVELMDLWDGRTSEAKLLEGMGLEI